MPSKGKPTPAGKTVRADKQEDAATRGDRSKRLLDLVMILLRARTPVTYRDVREQFPGRPAPRPEIGEFYATLEAATRLKKRVTLTYQTAATGMVSKRDIDPYAMVYREGAWLVVGWCHLRKEIRSFRVDRIHE